MALFQALMCEFWSPNPTTTSEITPNIEAPKYKTIIQKICKKLFERHILKGKFIW